MFSKKGVLLIMINFKKEVFRRSFPLDLDKIRGLSEEDKEKLVNIFRNAERKLMSMGGDLLTKGLVLEGKELLSFSSRSYVEMIMQVDDNIDENDIDIMNMMLYIDQYNFPFNLIKRPLMPRKYCIGDRKRLSR